jgi:RNA polymerase sigma factor (TIGR02999 family)
MRCSTFEEAPITKLIVQWKAGKQSSFNELFTYCHQQFKHEVRKEKLKQANREKPLELCIQTTTSIVHDAYLKMSGHREQIICDRKELYLLIAQVVRSVMYDHYRKLNSKKRQAPTQFENGHLEYNDTELHAKLLLADKSLTDEKPRCNQVLHLHIFAGLSADEIAKTLMLSVRTVHNDLKFAKAWYLAELSE